MKRIVYGVVICALLVMVSACGSVQYNDGEYTGVYNGEGESKMTVTLTLKDQKITDCKMECLDKMGNIKDEHYGEQAGEANFEKAQIALKGMKEYPKLLVELQSVDDMDAVSGATVSFKEFKEAVNDALKKAK